MPTAWRAYDQRNGYGSGDRRRARITALEPTTVLPAPHAKSNAQLRTSALLGERRKLGSVNATPTTVPNRADQNA
jgi:hypothetical protein